MVREAGGSVIQGGEVQFCLTMVTVARTPVKVLVTPVMLLVLLFELVVVKARNSPSTPANLWALLAIGAP